MGELVERIVALEHPQSNTLRIGQRPLCSCTEGYTNGRSIDEPSGWRRLGVQADVVTNEGASRTARAWCVAQLARNTLSERDGRDPTRLDCDLSDASGTA
jgi:hypothetical protein